MLIDCDNVVPLNVHPSPQTGKTLSLSRNLPQQKTGI